MGPKKLDGWTSQQPRLAGRKGYCFEVHSISEEKITYSQVDIKERKS